MTMRKYLVTVHEDGHVTALEFEEPADQALGNYQAGFRDAVHEILDCLERLKLSHLNKSRGHAQRGEIDASSAEGNKAIAMYFAIAELKRKYKVFGTRR